MNKIQKVIIEKLIPGGKGLARIEGKVVFVPFVLPGEEVEIKIVEEKKGYSEAELIKVIEASDDRVEPICPVYYKCGGCNMQHMNYESQLKAKSDFASNLLERNGKFEISDISVIPSKPYSYRNRVQIHIANGQKGFKERSSNSVIPVETCPISAGGVNRYLSQKKTESNEEKISVFGKENWFSTEMDNEEIHIKLNGKKVYFNSKLFFQSNVSILPQLQNYLVNHVEGETLIDLYSGVGLLSSMVEDKFSKIIAVEINKNVQQYIEKNIFRELKFYPMSIEKWISNKKTGKKADTIILDPPRTGLTKPVRRFLNRSQVNKIIYVSCDPATMARDLKDITADKYIIEDIKLFDFYPQTSHMEAVAVLRKKPS